MDWRSGLSGFTRLAGRANKFTKSGNIGTVSSDAGRIDRQTQALGSFYIDAGVIELGQAKPNGWKHALDSARVHRARRSVTLPRTICNCEELVPIVFVPHFSLLRPRDSRRSRHEMHQTPLWSLPDAHKGQTSGIRHKRSRVQHRLTFVTGALRKSNYRLVPGTALSLGKHRCFETFSGRFQVRFALMKPGAKPFQITSLRAFAVLLGQII